MKKRDVSILVVIVLVLVVVAIVGIKTSFTGSAITEALENESSQMNKAENLSFSGRENISRNLSIYRYANVTSAYINISGFINDPNTTDEDWTSYMGNLNATGYSTNDAPDLISSDEVSSSASPPSFASLAMSEHSLYAGGWGGTFAQVNVSNMSQTIMSEDIGSGVVSTPAVGENYLYVSTKGAFHQRNLSNASELIEKFDDTGDFTGYHSSPFTATVNGNDYVYVGSRGSSNAFFQMNASNVTEVVANHSGTYERTKAAMAELGGEKYIFAPANGALYKLNASNVSRNVSARNDIGSAGIAVDNGYIYAYDGSNVEQINASNISQTINSYSKASQGSSNNKKATLAVGNGYVYVPNSSGEVIQLDASDVSNEIAVYDTGDSMGATAPSVSDEYVFQTTSGGIYQLNASNVSHLISNNSIVQEGDEPAIFGNGHLYASDGYSAIYQIGGDYVDNSYLEVGNPDGVREWNYSGNFEEQEKVEIASALNDALQNNVSKNGTCPGGSRNSENCSIEFLFHSDSAGKLEYSNLSVNWTENIKPSVSASCSDINEGADLDCSCSRDDKGSGIASVSDSTDSGFGPDESQAASGSYTYTCKVTDKEGNTDISTAEYYVYSVGGVDSHEENHSSNDSISNEIKNSSSNKSNSSNENSKEHEISRENSSEESSPDFALEKTLVIAVAVLFLVAALLVLWKKGVFAKLFS